MLLFLEITNYACARSEGVKRPLGSWYSLLFSFTCLFVNIAQIPILLRMFRKAINYFTHPIISQKQLCIDYYISYHYVQFYSKYSIRQHLNPRMAVIDVPTMSTVTSMSSTDDLMI